MHNNLLLLGLSLIQCQFQAYVINVLFFSVIQNALSSGLLMKTLCNHITECKLIYSRVSESDARSKQTASDKCPDQSFFFFCSANSNLTYISLNNSYKGKQLILKARCVIIYMINKIFFLEFANFIIKSTVMSPIPFLLNFSLYKNIITVLLILQQLASFD